MLRRIKKIGLLGVALLGVSTSAQAVEFWIWQVPEIKGRAPVFYQEASKSSKSVSLCKPNQMVQILSKHKDWAKVSVPDNSGQIAWIPLDEVKAVTTVNITLNQSSNAYQCQLFLRDPEGREGNWGIVRRTVESSGVKEASKKGQGFMGWGFGKKDPALKEQEDFEKALLQLEEAFAKQRAVMVKMMGRLLPVMVEESTEMAKQAMEASRLASEAKVADNAKPQDTTQNKEKSVETK